jgi:tripartite-type tricarboxylate transporter receptor subunit TctC
MLKMASVLLAVGIAVVAPACAQEWPTRPVTMVIPYAAGSPADALGRVVGQHLSLQLHQPVIVDNASGAGGMIGANRVAKATPDGYLFIQGGMGTHALAQSLYKTPFYDAATDFSPVMLFGESSLILVARKDLPVNDLKGLTVYAKSHPLSYGSAGVGSTTHLSCLLLSNAMGVEFTHVPYRGMGLAMQDLAEGRIDIACDLPTSALPQVEGGTVKALAVLTKERIAALPQIMTAQEQGLTNFEVHNWNAYFLPKGTPDAIVKRMHDALEAVMEDPAVQKQLLTLGVVVPPREQRTAEYLGRFVESEVAKWGTAIKASGISIQ